MNSQSAMLSYMASNLFLLWSIAVEQCCCYSLGFVPDTSRTVNCLLLQEKRYRFQDSGKLSKFPRVPLLASGRDRIEIYNYLTLNTRILPIHGAETLKYGAIAGTESQGPSVIRSAHPCSITEGARKAQATATFDLSQQTRDTKAHMEFEMP